MSLERRDNSLLLNLKERARMLTACREFFKERDVTEVDCPILSSYPSIDAHIDLIPAFFSQHKKLYMHSSPEHGMKRLLAEGMGDIYQLSHVFRDGEYGALHNPEFMMAEWYRLGFSFDEMIQETYDFISLFLPLFPLVKQTYHKTFKEFAGIDYLTMNDRDLLSFIDRANIPTYTGIENESRDDLLNLILGHLIEPKLGHKCLFALTHYPASQAALSRTSEGVAERFEFYYKGVELANGFHELTDHVEQEERFKKQNSIREELNKEKLPIDYPFLEALKSGIPDCCGVAVGFDRLLLLKLGATSLKDILPLAWEKNM